MALALGLSVESSCQKIARAIKERLRRPVKPVIVDSGPVKENIVKMDDINL